MKVSIVSGASADTGSGTCKNENTSGIATTNSMVNIAGDSSSKGVRAAWFFLSARIKVEFSRVLGARRRPPRPFLGPTGSRRLP